MNNDTTQGVAMALRSMPQLCQVEYEFFFQLFDHLTQLDGDEGALEDLRLPAYRLTSLKSTEELNEDENMTTAVQLCPHSQSVALTAGPAFRESALWNLTRLNRLRELSLANGASAYPLDFYTSVVPLLQTVGHQINSLILTRFTCVDVLGTVGPQPQLVNNYYYRFFLLSFPISSHFYYISDRNELSRIKEFGRVGNLPLCAGDFGPSGTLHAAGSVGIVGTQWRPASRSSHQTTNDAMPARSKLTVP